MRAPRDLDPTSDDLLEGQASLDFGPPRPLVRAPRPGERKTVLEVLGRAFQDDPVAAHLFPSPRTRSAHWARFSGLAMDAMGSTAHVLTTDAVQGAAIWQLPTEARTGFVTRLRLALRFLAITGRGFRRAVRLGDLTSGHRLPEPHYYLAAIGTDPAHQGKGIGSALMQPVLDRCDRERIPAYLESSKERNVPFYQKHGFEVVEVLTVPNGPRVWVMARRTG